MFEIMFFFYYIKQKFFALKYISNFPREATFTPSLRLLRRARLLREATSIPFSPLLRDFNPHVCMDEAPNCS